MATSDFDAVVYGAGPVGAAVALGLQQRGHRVVVLEKRTEYQVIGDAGKSINLSLSTRGNALMKQLGVYDDLLSTLVPMVSRIFAGASIRAPLRLLSCPVSPALIYCHRASLLHIPRRSCGVPGAAVCSVCTRSHPFIRKKRGCGERKESSLPFLLFPLSL